DLDGSGKKEVIAYTNLRALAIDLGTGAVAWAQPQGEMGVVGGVRLTDMDGDGLPDIVIEECRGCPGGSMTQSAVIYAFPGGFSAPKRAALPQDTNAEQDTVTADMDGKPGSELLVTGFDGAQYDLFDLVDATGAVIAKSQTFAVG